MRLCATTTTTITTTTATDSPMFRDGWHQRDGGGGRCSRAGELIRMPHQCAGFHEQRRRGLRHRHLRVYRARVVTIRGQPRSALPFDVFVPALVVVVVMVVGNAGLHGVSVNRHEVRNCG